MRRSRNGPEDGVAWDHTALLEGTSAVREFASMTTEQIQAIVSDLEKQGRSSMRLVMARRILARKTGS